MCGPALICRQLLLSCARDLQHFLQFRRGSNAALGDPTVGKLSCNSCSALAQISHCGKLQVIFNDEWCGRGHVQDPVSELHSGALRVDSPCAVTLSRRLPRQSHKLLAAVEHINSSALEQAQQITPHSTCTAASTHKQPQASAAGCADAAPLSRALASAAVAAAAGATTWCPKPLACIWFRSARTPRAAFAQRGDTWARPVAGDQRRSVLVA